MAEVTAFRNNALPYPVYGVSYTVVAPLLDADGDPVSPSSPDSEVSLNGDTFTDCTNEAVEIATSSGVVYLILTAAETTADIVTVRIQSTGAKTTILTLYPRKLPVLSSGTCQGSNDTGDIQLASGDSSVDDFYSGCLCVAVIDGTTEARIINDYVGSTKVGKVSPAWNTAQPDSSDTYTIYQPEGRSVQNWLQPTTAGRTLTIESDGMAHVDVKEILGDGQSVTDWKDFADAGYDPAAHKVQGVVLVDTTTTNTDMRGTDNAAQAGDEMDLVDAPNATALAAIAAATEAVILDEGDATALLAAIAAKVEEFLINEGDATATLAAIATAVWGNATRTLTAGTNIQLPANGLANITSWTVAITGNITGDLSGSIGSLGTQAKADVNAEADAAIETYHLDHLLATTYDPASKPGAADALLNELVENDGGVSRFTANALEQGPNTTTGLTLDAAYDAAKSAASASSLSSLASRIPAALTADGMMKADVKYVNGVEVDGTGTSEDPWGPA